MQDRPEQSTSETYAKSALQFPRLLEEKISARIHADRTLRILGKKKAYAKLEVDYSQLQSALRDDRGLGPVFLQSAIRALHATPEEQHQLWEAYQAYRQCWTPKASSNKDRSIVSVSDTEAKQFRREIKERLGLTEPQLYDPLILVNIADNFVEKERLLGRGREALTNGLLLIRWMDLYIDDERLEINLLRASIVRLVCYTAFTIYDGATFRRMMSILQRLAKSTGDPWIASSYFQNVRREQIAFATLRDPTLLLESATSTIEYAKDAVSSMSSPILASWQSSLLLAEQALTQTKSYLGTLDRKDINRLRLAEAEHLISFPSGDAILISRLALAEAELRLGHIDSAESELESVKNELDNKPHLYDGIRAVMHRLSADKVLLAHLPLPRYGEDAPLAAQALYELSRFHFSKIKNQKIGEKLDRRTSIVRDIEAKRVRYQTHQELYADPRFSEPIW